jgi:predicted nucleic acid-binding Zn ribbon protein
MAAVGEELGIGDPRSVGRLENAWVELVGPAIAEHAHVRSLRRGVLTIAVDAAPWATQLRYLETEIVGRAAGLLGEGQVTQARIVVEAAARGAREDPRNDAP